MSKSHLQSLSAFEENHSDLQMESSIHRSVFQNIRSSELDGFRARKRPCLDDDSWKASKIGDFAFGVDEDNVTPPMALSFCKTTRNAHILAVTGEDGYVSLYNTRFKYSYSATENENADKARICEWLAHDNAIFDVCWIKEDTNLLTACGDHSIKLWDTEERKDLAILTGHTGSVKSISAHPSNNDMIVSGSRDGSFALWDLRSSKRRRNHLSASPTAVVQGAHSSSNKTRGRHGKAVSMSITSVLYLKDEVSIATAGAADSVVMFWDTRNLTAPVTKVWSHDNTSRKWVRSHGISSLSQDLNGVYISASCMDSRIYLYNVLQLEDGPVKSFSGCDISTFFVKSSLSPDAGHILSGSSDGNAYVWQVDKPKADPIVLNGHGGEVTAVDWCSSEIGKIATTADDSMVRLWNINNSCYSNTRSPSSIRRRVSALPKIDRRTLFTNEANTSTTQPESEPPVEPSVQINSPEMRTPESLGKQSSKSYIHEPCDRSPDATLGSPSSVLNPPPSLKRKTILDYFLAPS
ncbi:hypothetical protein L6452_44616 [Arctium lappa]|uniref:Uncharacterized protein n=1 Tax=Arctium lappa TaxID=4217 RepID=A0ACB8XKA3_ARCLA|nr:hypothetical protein L6452_44616 [Arctium lappa]